MRHGDGGISCLAFGHLQWQGWAAPARRARQAISFALVGTILTLGGATTHAHARLVLPDETSSAGSSGAVRAIPGWTEFCSRMPQECTIDAAEPAAIPLSVAVWRTLRSVNRRVNARIRPITDQAHWGVVDRWDFPDDGFGDCEDYQLLKRRMLAERGLSRRALLMTVVIDETNEGHAVLTVRTDRGDFILDNKTDAIRPWRRTGYSYIKRAGQDGPAWVSLEGKDGTAQVATAEP
jgi:predicted transglutaminase-like cysteine proteinase